MFKKYRGTFLFMACVLIAWEVGVTWAETATYLLPAPTVILSRLVSQWQMLLGHASVTLLEVAGGFSLGVTLGMSAATMMHRSALVKRTVGPMVIASQTFPKEALAPLFIVLLGPGLMPKVLVAGMISFFPMTINTMRGLLSADPLAHELFSSLAATRWQRFFMLEVPSALPFIFTGLKMSVTLSVIGAVVGEFVGASAGLGYLTQLANDTMQTDLMFASLFLLGSMGVALYGIVDGIERFFFTRWMPQ